MVGRLTTKGPQGLDGSRLFFWHVRKRLKETGAARVLDFGAGRGGWFTQSDEAREVFDLRPHAEVWACDIDEAVLTHPGSDKQVLLTEGERFPFPDASFRLIISDVTFEHITTPAFVASELKRILAPGGTICARTPNKWGYPALFARFVPNRFHRALVSLAQPGTRFEHDVFPTAYKLNRPRTVMRHFRGCSVEWYFDSAEPSYCFGSPLVTRTMKTVHRLLPETLSTSICFFITKV